MDNKILKWSLPQKEENNLPEKSILAEGLRAIGEAIPVVFTEKFKKYDKTSKDFAKGSVVHSKMRNMWNDRI